MLKKNENCNVNNIYKIIEKRLALDYEAELVSKLPNELHWVWKRISSL